MENQVSAHVCADVYGYMFVYVFMYGTTHVMNMCSILRFALGIHCNFKACVQNHGILVLYMFPQWKERYLYRIMALLFYMCFHSGRRYICYSR